ncbi:MAG: putative toxin-antitoxin system toxin component, PIN family [Balneolaceae bacterium]
MESLQIVLDINILYSGFRSKRGASYRLLSLLDSEKFTLNLSVPLVIEYEDVLKRNPPSLHIMDQQIDQFLDYLCLKGKWHEVYFLWRPFLKDPEDDMILELAVRANCQYIITYNRADFSGVNQFGIEVVTAQEFLKLIKELT